MKKYLLLIPLIVLFWTCSEDNNPTQSQIQNSPPVIHEIIANPSQPQCGQVVTLNAIATDSDGDELSYNWSTSAGQLAGNGTGNPIEWTAPSVAGDYTLICIVSDGKEIATANIPIPITFEYGMLNGIVYNKDTNIPIIGARVIITHNQIDDYTNTFGYYEIFNIPTGLQPVRVSKEISRGNTFFLYDTIEIFAGNNELDFYLTID